MKLIVLADIHGKIERLEPLSDILATADAAILAGDITDFGDYSDWLAVYDWLVKRLTTILAVPGNCDVPQAADWLAQAGVSVHGHCKVVNGVAFVGAGAATSGSGTTLTAEQYQQLFDQAMGECPPDAAGRLVVVLHQPPYGTALDKPAGSAHTGNPIARQFIERYQPTLAISGHLHDIITQDHIGKTILINGGAVKKGRYTVIDWPEGGCPTIQFCKI